MGHIENVQHPPSGRFRGRGLSRIVGDMVTINDVVVPISLTGLESGALEAKGAFPRTRLGGCLILGQWELTGVVIPGAKEMNGLDARRRSQREGELHGCHYFFWC